MASVPGAVVTLGDNAYTRGTGREFAAPDGTRSAASAPQRRCTVSGLASCGPTRRSQPWAGGADAVGDGAPGGRDRQSRVVPRMPAQLRACPGAVEQWRVDEQVRPGRVERLQAHPPGRSEEPAQGVPGDRQVPAAE